VSIQLHTISDTSPAAASTAAGDVLYGLGRYDALQITAELVGATGGVLNVYLQTSPDGGTSWFDYIAFPQLSAGASAVKYMVNVPQAGASGITVVGKNTSPALAANTVVGGSWGDRLRALYVAGTSTSAGAAVVINVLGYQRKI
jgi:hypothetical protein